MGVGDDQLHALQAARDERTHELAPERLGLGLADVDAEDLAPARLVHAVGDHDRLADHAAAVADLLDVGVDPGRGVGLSAGPFPRAALRNRTCALPRIRLSAGMRVLMG